MLSIEQAIETIVSKSKIESMNKYIKGFEIRLVISPDDVDELVEKFNSGTTGKISIVTEDSGNTYISWAPTQSDLNIREKMR